MLATDVTDAELEGLIAEPGTVLVDFWAEWCQPCKAMAPTLDAIAQEHGEQFKVAKVDVGAHPDAAKRYRINGIPHLVLFQDGEIVARLTGAQSKDAVLRVVLPLVAQ
jgi:thioredoxin 1